MEKDALNIPRLWCIVECLVLAFILICFTAFGHLNFLYLSCEAFTSNICKILAKLRVDIFAEFIFAIHDPTHRKLFWEKIKKYALLTKIARNFKERIQKST